MIRIIINNQEVYLDPKTSLRLDLVHPAFESEYLHASMIYPFDIPAVENESIFNYANHIIVNTKYRIYDCEFIFANAINFTGKLVLSKLSSTSFRGSIITNGFSIDAKDILLKDFDFDSDVSLGTSSSDVGEYVEANVAKTYPSTNFNFPMIKADHWYGENNHEFQPDFGGFVNFWISASQRCPINFIQENAVGKDNFNSLLPCLYLIYLLKKCFHNLGFQLTGEFADHEELSQLLVFNNSPLDFTDTKYNVKASNRDPFQQINSMSWMLLKFDDDFNLPNQDPDNAWSAIFYKYTIQSAGHHTFTFNFHAECIKNEPLHTHHLKITISDITDSVSLTQEEFDFEYDEEYDALVTAVDIWFESSQIGNEVTFSASCYYVNLGPMASDFKLSNMVIDIMNTSVSNLNSFKKSLHYADHVPDMTFGKLISSIADSFGLFILFDHQNGMVEMNFLQSIIENHNSIDLTDQFIEGSHEILLKAKEGYNYQFKWDSNDFDEEKYYTEFLQLKYIGEFDTFNDLYIPTYVDAIAYVKNTNTLYRFVTDSGTSRWSVYSYYFPPFIASPVTKPKELDLSPLMLADDPGNLAILPHTQIKCSSPAYLTGVNKCDLHLLFYRGLVGDEEAYPFASPYAYDYYGNKSWDLELRLDGNEGMMKNFLSDWLDFVNDSQEVSMDFNLNMQDLQNVMKLFLPQTGNKFRKILVHGTEYIPKKFSIMLTLNGIQSCQGNLVKKGMIGI